MTQAGMPNPIELYEGARDYMIPIIGGAQASQLSGSTPCTEWNVQQLINHNLLVARFFNSILTGGEPVDPFAVGGDLPEEGAQDAFVAGTNKVLEAIKVPGMLEKVVPSPFGEMPAGNLLMMPFGDILIHKWDLAKATGQDLGYGQFHGRCLLPGFFRYCRGCQAGRCFRAGGYYSHRCQ